MDNKRLDWNRIRQEARANLREGFRKGILKKYGVRVKFKGEKISDDAFTINPIRAITPE